MSQGIIELQFKKISVPSVIDLAIAPLQSQINQKQINFKSDIENNLPEISIDLEKLAWVLVNFIANSLRYTPKWGKVTIKAQKKDSQIVFSVRDSGAGIKPKDLERVFKSVVDKDTPGLGLALSISREIIEAHGGKIWVESSIGEGSTFYFSIPL